jgi:hypothetical protein
MRAALRERGGNSIPAVFKSEDQAISFISRRVTKGALLNADEALSWNALHARFEVKRINHEEAYSRDGACTNAAEEFFSRMHRAEIGPPPAYRGDIPASLRARGDVAGG